MKWKRFSVEQIVAVPETSRVGHHCGRPDSQGWDHGTDLLSMEEVEDSGGGPRPDRDISSFPDADAGERANPALQPTALLRGG